VLLALPLSCTLLLLTVVLPTVVLPTDVLLGSLLLHVSLLFHMSLLLLAVQHPMKLLMSLPRGRCAMQVKT
jgi:nitrate reductase gamma subunit